MTAAFRRSVDSLHVPNYRRYFAGQLISITGNWMQMVAEMWLIVRLTNSGLAVGVAAALQFVPILLLGAYGGVIADRIDKRRLLMVTQTLMMVPAFTLFALTASGHVTVGIVFACVFARGCILALDNPTRQAFVSELVGSDRVVNAVSLNSVIVHTSRIIGPALAGTLIAIVGVAPCFLANGLSFLAMLIVLRRVDRSALFTPARVARAKGQVRAALSEVRRRPELRVPLAMMAVVGTLSFNFQILLPLLARLTWHGTATTYALMTASMGIGSVSGALMASARARVSSELLIGSATMFGLAELGVAAAPTLPVQLIALIPLGAASVTFAAGINSTLQLAAGPEWRGRVMALYSVVFLGSTPIGAPAIGWLAGAAGPRAGLLVGAIAALATAVYGTVAFDLRKPREPALISRARA